MDKLPSFDTLYIELTEMRLYKIIIYTLSIICFYSCTHFFNLWGPIKRNIEAKGSFRLGGMRIEIGVNEFLDALIASRIISMKHTADKKTIVVTIKSPKKDDPSQFGPELTLYIKRDADNKKGNIQISPPGKDSGEEKDFVEDSIPLDLLNYRENFDSNSPENCKIFTLDERDAMDQSSATY